MQPGPPRKGLSGPSPGGPDPRRPLVSGLCAGSGPDSAGSTPPHLHLHQSLLHRASLSPLGCGRWPEGGAALRRDRTALNSESRSL